MGTVRLDRDAGVATLTLDNEARLNAMSLSMWTALADHLDALAQDDGTRVVVLRGAGGRAFVAGADISEFESQRADPDAVARYDAQVDRAQGALARFVRPVIAAIGGVCYGGGIGLALACDLRLAAPDARFRMPAARLGLGYAPRGMRRMVEVLGPARAGELFYTARVFGAADAARIGLVNEVREDVFAAAHEMARDIAANAPLTVAAAKLAIRAADSDDAALLAQAEAAAARCFGSQDYIEGRRAFMEKRTPRFTGE